MFSVAVRGSRWNVAAMSNTLEKHSQNTSVLVKLSNIMVPKVQKELNRLIVHKMTHGVNISLPAACVVGGNPELKVGHFFSCPKLRDFEIN